MDLGIITARLRGYGGSEIFLLECLKRWQHRVAITVYTAAFDRGLFEEFGIDGQRVDVVRLPRTPEPATRFTLLQECILLPRLWEQSIGRHDVTFHYLFPTQFVRRSPSVWFAAEPLRILYDLRHHASGGDPEIEVHLYPKPFYDTLRLSDLDAQLEIIEGLDSLSQFDRLATNSRIMGRYLENVYGRKADRIVYPGVNPCGDTGPPSSAKRALSIGRLWKQKRVDLIVRAMAHVPEGELVIVGTGPEKKRLRDLTRRLGVDDRVRFAGAVTSSELRRLHVESTCCVYTPVREPFGMVPLEAAAAGRPVIATAEGGFTEVLDERCTRFVPAVPEAIGAAIRTIFEDPGLARSMGEAGRDAVSEMTWDRTAGSLLDLLGETLESRRAKRRESYGPATVPRPTLGAHYYPWYRAGDPPQHWNENTDHAAVTDFPVGGPYSSTDEALVERHLRLCVDAGLDFLVVNWQVGQTGLNPVELEATRMLFDHIEARGHPVALSLLLAVHTESPPIIADALEILHRDFLPRPAYQRIQENPLIWYFLNDSFLGYFYHNLQDLARANESCLPVAAGGIVYSRYLPRPLRRFFRAWTLYSPLEVAPAKVRRAIWTRSYHDFDDENLALRAFTICPGYDDTHLTSTQRKANRRRRVPRAGLRTYREMQETALALSPTPDLVVVTSFNEFHENTHIEPSEKHGDRYLRATREFKRRLAAEAALAAPSRKG